MNQIIEYIVQINTLNYNYQCISQKGNYYHMTLLVYDILYFLNR